VAYTFAIPASDRGDGPNYWFEFGRFVQRYGKTYASVEEFSSRFGVFKNWLNVIEKHNAQEGQTYQLAVNQFADLTWEEFRSFYLKRLQRNDNRAHKPRASAHSVESIDWRAKGCVNGIKDQGASGSCWAYSAIASLECANFLKTGKLPDLSEKQVAECSPSQGHIDDAFEYVIKNHGVECEGDFDGQCKADPTKPVCGTCTNYSRVASSEDALQTAVSSQVVSVSICANEDFMFYSQGIFDSKNCPSDHGSLNHGVAVVGFDSSAGYWIVRNSWGVSWGENGYIRMKMGSNLCGIVDDALVPIA